MGRMSDLHIELQNLEAEWILCIHELFVRRGYLVEEGRRGADLVVQKEGVTTVFEVRIYRSENLSKQLLGNAVATLVKVVASYGADRGVLAISQLLPSNQSYEFVSQAGLEIWDLARVAKEVNEYPDLLTYVERLTELQQIGADKAPHSSKLGVAAPPLVPSSDQGTKIAQRLKSIAAGKKNSSARQFEQTCSEALRFLYGSDFLGWRAQSMIENGFQRVDLVGRLVPKQENFWATLASDFRTRYVIFEFKNYSNRIGQDQIYSTEKYLFPRALRSVAVIIARNGANKSAARAISGALREQGKIMLCITLAEFCALLEGYDEGKDPTSLLVERLDDLLMTIAP